MNLKIRLSDKMSDTKSALGSIEDRLIRLPAKIREENGLLIGSFLSCVTKDGDAINLKVFPAYASEVDEDPEAAWVSKSTHSLLNTKSIKQISSADKILIGCDPEFFIVNAKTLKTISASNFFAHYGDIGSDCGLAELRPRPAFKEEDLTFIMRELFLKALSHINDRKLFTHSDIDMIASSYHNSNAAGFHIHFGLPNFMLRTNNSTYTLLSYIVCILDYYLGIPAIWPEGNEDNTRRSVKYSRYGKPGDYRYDSMTLEYRVPGGHLLRHPILSNGIIAIAKTVMNDILTRLKTYSNNFSIPIRLNNYDALHKFYPRLPSRKEVFSAITSENIALAASYTDKIFEDISLMTNYNESKPSILKYFNYVVQYFQGKTKYNKSISINWRLRDNER